MYDEIKKILIDQGNAFESFKAKNDAKVGALESTLTAIEKKLGRPGAAASGDDNPQFKSLRTTDGKSIPLLAKGERLSSRKSRESEHSDDGFSIGEYVRDAIVGSRKAVGSGPALVPTYLSDEIIDDVRAQSVIVEAGSRTIIIDGPTVLARINGDPDVIQHVENVADITESDVSVGPVTVNPQLLVAMIPLSEEVVADSPNLDAVLQMSISAAFAQKLDTLILAKLLADPNVFETPGVSSHWENIVSHVSHLNRMPTVMVSALSSYLIRLSIREGDGSGLWIGVPPSLAKVVEHPTANMPHNSVIFGGFDLGLLIAARSELRLEVVRWRNAGKGQHVLVAHSRMDGYVVQPKAFSRLVDE